MTEDGFLTLIGILAAGFGLLRPTRRILLPYLVPVGRSLLVLSAVASMLVLRRAIDERWISWGLLWLPRGLQIASFVLVLAWLGWSISRLAGKRVSGRVLPVDRVLREALLGNDVGDAAAVLLENRSLVTQTPPEERELLFERAVVDEFLRRGSEMHLELLGDESIFQSLRPSPLRAVDNVMLASLRSPDSTLRSLVLALKGGEQGHRLRTAQGDLAKSTFLSSVDTQIRPLMDTSKPAIS